MNITTKALSLCTLLVVSITAQAGPEKEWEIVHTITKPINFTSPTTFDNHRFGESVALSRDGKTLLVAAATENCAGGPDCGAAYVYRLEAGQWLEEARLAASDETPNAQFGGWDFYDRTVALSKDGNTALVAAVNGSGLGRCRTGAVYVFVREQGSWHEQQKLTLPEALLPEVRLPNPSCDPLVVVDRFGRSVDLSDDGRTAIVGAMEEGIPDRRGAAYLFESHEGLWVPTARLTGSQTGVEGAPSFRSSRLGTAVAISGNGHTVLVGTLPSFSVDNPSSDPTTVAAYVFGEEDGSWTERAILTPAVPRQAFGNSVALSHNGHTALVGSAGRVSPAGVSPVEFGRPNVFQQGDDGVWTEEARLGLDLTVSIRFGFSLDINDNGHTAVVGDWVPGTAHTFTRHENDDGSIEWKSQLALDCAQVGCLGFLGSSVAISGNARTLFVGYRPGGFLPPNDAPCPGGGLCTTVFGLGWK